MKQHFVTFLSPGTFVAETNVKPIASWDVNLAMDMARTIVQRYNATPYAFQFTTRGRSDSDLDSAVIATSPTYYLGGVIETLEEIEARNDPKERILATNMRGNGYARVIRNENSWRWTQPFNDGDVRLEFTPTGKEPHDPQR